MAYYLNLIEQTPIVFFSKFRSKNTGYYLEYNNLVLPDNYMIDFDNWCNYVVPEVNQGIKKFPWESRIEKAFFRGAFTGHHLDYFPVGIFEHNPSPDQVKNLILEDPNRWKRAYLAYFLT